MVESTTRDASTRARLPAGSPDEGARKTEDQSVEEDRFSLVLSMRPVIFKGENRDSPATPRCRVHRRLLVARFGRSFKYQTGSEDSMATETTQQGTKSTTKLKEKLQEQLDAAKQRLEDAKQEISSLHEADKESISKMSAAVQQRIEQQQKQVQALRTQVDSWIQEKKSQSKETIASWRQKREIKHLERRADRAEEYALNAVIVAMMDADDAEMAVLDALDARLDAEAAAATPT